MGAAILGLILLAAGLAAYAYWIFALTRYDPKERHCDGNCESCPFPPDGCSEKGKRA